MNSSIVFLNCNGSFFEFVNYYITPFINLIAIASLVFTIWFHRLYIKRFENTETNIKSSQTHKIDKFPKNMTEVIKLLESAKESIEIYSDLTCWGIYSEPYVSNEYRDLLQMKKIKSLNGEITVHIYTYNEKYTQEAMAAFFNPEDTTIEKIKESTYAKFLEKKYPHSKNVEFKNIKTIPDFTDFMTKQEKEFKEKLDDKTLGEKYENKRIKTDLPYFMWIKDDSEAIIDLPYPYYIEQGKEDSIKTSDKALIKIFKDFLDMQIKDKIE